MRSGQEESTEPYTRVAIGSPQFKANPYPVYARLRREQQRAQPWIPKSFQPLTSNMLDLDAPDHTRYRKLVSRAFTARAVAALRTRTEEIAAGLLDGLASRGGGVDLMADYASLLPATVIAEMLGAPVEMSRQFLAWGAEAGKSLDAGLTLREFRRFVQAHPQWRRDRVPSAFADAGYLQAWRSADHPGDATVLDRPLDSAEPVGAAGS